MHLDGFIIRIYHDTRSPECQNVVTLFRYLFKTVRNITDTFLKNILDKVPTQFQLLLVVLELPSGIF